MFDLLGELVCLVYRYDAPEAQLPTSAAITLASESAFWCICATSGETFEYFAGPHVCEFNASAKWASKLKDAVAPPKPTED
eukprot:1623843-Prymnesium_polylepis.2